MSDNVLYMWYGIFAAWAIVLIYVLLLNLRERKLREQVRKLTVMIDRKKVEEEASAITDTDYFKSLAEKASQIRKENADAKL